MRNGFLYVLQILGAYWLFFGTLFGQEIAIPTLAQGRVRPLISYVYLMEKQLCWSISSFGEGGKTLDRLWQIHRQGSSPFFHDPFFVLSPDLAERSGLPGGATLYSYLQLHEIFTIESPLYKALSRENSSLLPEFVQMVSALQLFQRLDGVNNRKEKNYRLLRKELEKRGMSPFQTGEYLDALYPFPQRLQEAGELFRILPGRGEDEWFSAHALALDVFDPIAETFIPSPNFTRFSTEDFRSLQVAYRQWLSGQMGETSQFLATLETAHAHAGSWPWRCRFEAILVCFPWVITIAFFYLLAGCVWVVKQGWWLGRVCFWCAFLGNAGILLVRSLILKRPPVSNMTETLLFVPLVGSSIALMWENTKVHWLHFAACIGGASLLLLSWWQEPIPILGNIQPVLNSWMWLSWHVLLVVSSYALFLMASIVGHVCLVSSQQKRVGSLLLKVLYTGIVLLILGTLLGGAWAAESWGRFWDWDPKESWAFISICTYLLFVHAFQRGYIGYWGLGVGAVLGFISISFTWYGVNYLLGAGLHSYGFGRGGVEYYLAFLCAELVWLVYCWMKHRMRTT